MKAQIIELWRPVSDAERHSIGKGVILWEGEETPTPQVGDSIEFTDHRSSFEVTISEVTS